MEEQNEQDMQFEDATLDELTGTDQKVAIGLHPLGGIAMAVTGPDGTEVVARIDLEQAFTIIGHLNALTGMFIGQAYAQAAQEQAAAAQAASKIHLPR